jgi:hypothetical protein
MFPFECLHSSHMNMKCHRVARKVVNLLVQGPQVQDARKRAQCCPSKRCIREYYTGFSYTSHCDEVVHEVFAG